MVFHSPAFILGFLPVVLTVYFILARRVSSPRPALLWLVAASLAFYASWEIRYVPLLLGWHITIPARRPCRSGTASSTSS
jgi:hypothetical protein